MTSIVNAIRDLLTQQPVGGDIGTALAWCVGILIDAYTLAMVIYAQDLLAERRVGCWGVAMRQPARLA